MTPEEELAYKALLDACLAVAGYRDCEEAADWKGAFVKLTGACQRAAQLARDALRAKREAGSSSVAVDEPYDYISVGPSIYKWVGYIKDLAK